MEQNIRGIVYGKFKSIRCFAEAIGWDRTKACNIVNGVREPKLSELQELSRLLEVPIKTLADIFLGSSSHICD